ncbi:MAG TPA: hypothetical protein V6D03_05055 [Candidatus Caenarcaniphilales bacterium]
MTASLPRNSGRILTLGYKPGRNLVYFRAQGHRVTGLDATPAFRDGGAGIQSSLAAVISQPSVTGKHL